LREEFGIDKSAGEDLMYKDNPDKPFRPFRIVGIVKDFNFETFKDKVRPLVVFFTKGRQQLAYPFMKQSAGRGGNRYQTVEAIFGK